MNSRTLHWDSRNRFHSGDSSENVAQSLCEESDAEKILHGIQQEVVRHRSLTGEIIGDHSGQHFIGLGR
jgi:hypothetical protein